MNEEVVFHCAYRYRLRRNRKAEAVLRRCGTLRWPSSRRVASADR